jgi:hypothetical protein
MLSSTLKRAGRPEQQVHVQLQAASTDMCFALASLCSVPPCAAGASGAGSIQHPVLLLASLCPALCPAANPLLNAPAGPACATTSPWPPPPPPPPRVRPVVCCDTLLQVPPCFILCSVLGGSPADDSIFLHRCPQQQHCSTGGQEHNSMWAQLAWPRHCRDGAQTLP